MIKEAHLGALTCKQTQHRAKASLRLGKQCLPPLQLRSLGSFSSVLGAPPDFSGFVFLAAEHIHTVSFLSLFCIKSDFVISA